MGLSKYRLGDFIMPISSKCGISKCKDVKGINIDKEFFPSRNVGEDTSKYLEVPPKSFAMNLMHIGRDERIPIALNTSSENIIVSPAYDVFYVVENDFILLEYFNIIIRSSEFDRYAWFCTDSSVRGNLDWKRFCDIEIEIPAIKVQQKYVDIYNALKANQEAYEQGLDDLKLTCDAYIENLFKTNFLVEVGEFVEMQSLKNEQGYTNVVGISTNKNFIKTKADLTGINLASYKVVPPKSFAYVADTSRRGDKISLALNQSKDCYLVSSISTVFKTIEKKLLPEFLTMFFNRSEFDRYARYHSWGSAREVFSWNDLCEVKIPIPSIEIQESIVNIYNAYMQRKQINEKLKQQIKDICPILIKGSLEEGKR